jgi:tetratricopeptide (TPR) repeat protein
MPEAALLAEAADAPDLVTGRTSAASRASDSARGPRLDPIAEAVLGGGLPPAAERSLRLAGLAYHDDLAAERHLLDAAAAAPGHAAVLIGLYRFYFYKGRLREALAIARECLVKSAQDNGLSTDWRRVQRGDADFENYAALLPRFFLFTLKGYGYLNMRLGDLAEGRAALGKLLELDPADRLGARVLLGVLDRMGHDDDD